MSLVLQSSGGGSLTIQEPVTASNLTATLPAASGSVMVSGNMPAFSAYKNASNQSFSSTTVTQVTFDVEEFDTNNNFASSRFTPTVAGYYQINWCLDVGAATATLSRVSSFVAKNGSFYKIGSGTYSGFTGTEFSSSGAATVYCNGTTDYLEIYVFVSATSPVVYTGAANTWFQGILSRTA